MSTTTTPVLPKTQKALLLNTSTNHLSLSLTHPVPPPSPTAHLLKVHSTAPTNGELTWAPYIDPPWPQIHPPCYDVSGTILTPVANSPFAVGDKVYGRVDARREGTAREYAEILPSEAALVPRGMSMRDAASVPMSALTAWQAVFEQGLLTGPYGVTSVPFVNEGGKVVGGQAKGKRVLVLGAAGAVGSLVVQFAKLAGAYVAGTASERSAEYVESVGADAVIKYTETSLIDWVRGEESMKFDLVVDCVGGQLMLDGWSVARAPGGVYVSIAPGFREPEGGKPEGVRSKWFIMESRGTELDAIGKFFEKDLLKTRVDSVWKIEDFKEAFARTDLGHASGKVIIEMTEEDYHI